MSCVTESPEVTDGTEESGSTPMPDESKVSRPETEGENHYGMLIFMHLCSL